MRLSADIDVARLKDAWTRAIASFDILRTTFHFLPGQGVWAQAVHSTPSVQWSDTQAVDDTQLTEIMNPFLRMSEENEMFSKPPIFLNVVHSPGQAPRLILVLHHALYDGLSIAGLFHAVEEMYHGSAPRPSTQYHQLLSHILWQENNGTSFWVDRLRELRHAPLPRNTTMPEIVPTVHHATLQVQLAEAEIRQACSYAEVTPQCIGQAAFVKLLAVMTRRRDVIFGRVVSGRDMQGAEEVIGPMLVRLFVAALGHLLNMLSEYCAMLRPASRER